MNEEELEDPDPNGCDDKLEKYDDVEEEFEDDEVGPCDVQSSDRLWLSALHRRLAAGPVRLHVYDVVITGNKKTKDSLIEAEVLEIFRSASTMQEVLQAANEAKSRLQRLELFDSVTIILRAGPPELPGTTNVIIELVEPSNPLSSVISLYGSPETQDWSFQGLLNLRNILGYGDIWNIAGSFDWYLMKELSSGLSLPRLKGLSTPFTARVSFVPHDWLKFSSYKDCLLDLSLGLISTMHHNLVYSFKWRHLTENSRLSSTSVRRQLGHNFLSSLKYTYKIDQRNSQIRPTRGYAFLSASHICGLGPDDISRYIRQEFDLRAAIPLVFLNSALNFGVAACAVMPWSTGFMNSPILPDRSCIAGSSSPIFSLGRLTSLFGFTFKTRGLGPTDIHKLLPIKDDGSDSPVISERDAVGADISVTAFADLTFDLLPKSFRNSGMHGHVFIAAGNMINLTAESSVKYFSLGKFAQKFRSSAGFGVVVPTKMIRMEVNYCHILHGFKFEKRKSGIQFSFSPNPREIL